MKNLIFCFLSIGISLLSKGQEVTITGSTKGVAPITSFKTDDPALMFFFKFNLADSGFWEHVELSPDIAFSSKTVLWFGDMWARINYWSKRDTLRKTIYTVGLDFPSPFGQQYTLPDGKEITQVVIYYTLQGKVVRRVGKNLSFTFDYWYLECTKMRYGVKGHYVSLSSIWNKEIDNKNFVLSANPNLFYLNFTDGTNGLVGSLELNIIHPKTGLFAGVLGLTPITSNQVKRNWNVSVGKTILLH